MENGLKQRDIGQVALLAATGIGVCLACREMLRQRREADLRGQIALITGGSRGLGFLLAREFARAGCRIALCARDEQELKRAQQDLEPQGRGLLTVRCDVSDRAQVDRLVEKVTDHFGRIDILVNNAGIIEVGPIQAMTVQDFEETMDTNFWGAVYATLAVLPQMRKRKSGRIVNVTSIGGKVSVPHLLPYCCSKFAAMGFSEGLRAELARDGIVVTTIAPGLIRTGSHLNAYVKGDQEKEFAAFGLSATLPILSMNAEQAARQIVEATRRGEAERILGAPANLLARFHGLFPGATADLFGLANRLALPSADGGETEAARGEEVQKRMHAPLLSLLMTLGGVAANRLHQHPGPQTAPAPSLARGLSRNGSSG